jgi:membrane fusion protein (multidrug efflux system)
MNEKAEAGRKAHGKLLLVGVALVAGIVLLTTVLIVKGLKKKKPDASPTELTPVAIMAVDKRYAEEEVRMVGKIEPIRDVTVAVEIAGRYTEMPSDVGDEVKKGDVLVKIDDSLPRAALIRAEAEFDDSKRELGRLESLFKKGAVSESAVDAAKTRHAVARGSRDEASAWLAKSTVTSPISGRVEEKYIEVGEYALDGNRAFRVADLSEVKVVVYMPERDVVSVKKGDTLRFSVLAVPGKNLEGKVSFVASAAEAHNHAFRVELLAANQDGLLKGGMIADVTLGRKTQEEVAKIPFTAVLPRKGEHIVFLHENGRAVRRTVRIHSMAGESALISTGLEGGEQLVIEGQKFLQDGRAVSLVEEGQEQ